MTYHIIAVADGHYAVIDDHTTKVVAASDEAMRVAIQSEIDSYGFEDADFDHCVGARWQKSIFEGPPDEAVVYAKRQANDYSKVQG